MQDYTKDELQQIQYALRTYAGPAGARMADELARPRRAAEPPPPPPPSDTGWVNRKRREAPARKRAGGLTQHEFRCSVKAAKRLTGQDKPHTEPSMVRHGGLCVFGRCTAQ